MLVSVGLVSKVSGAVSAVVRPVASVDVHVVVVTLLFGKALLADAAHKRPVGVSRMIGQNVIFHLVLVALLATVVTGGVHVNLVHVVVQPPFALELHTTICALVCLFGVAVALVVVVPALPDTFSTQFTVNNGIAAGRLGPYSLVGELLMFSQLMLPDEGFTTLVADKVSLCFMALLMISQLGPCTKHFVTTVTGEIFHMIVLNVSF